ncbi:tripartite tricarboxylate transporter substrate binding protein [Cupriavidus sp. UYPR2.512]|uniref:Bug family tripartite tricarboxylate transporter substrate binding protein n=1 Tax=Cupriavidus sp. UYPR2.512 TaxID=1080187 RepID=UPI000369435F|nr:tripartite tricarboxylate transporter substrate binding protein [Cupriavidus sp. UYPR2.512]UIF84707.1 tripartite tricarboxylate transporter substrate binding protein [Cupriavidus necator]
MLSRSTRWLSLGRRRLLSVITASSLTAVLAGITSFPAIAQNGKPVRLILPLSAGSGADTIARAAGPALTKAMGQPVVIENLPGAGGVTGTAQVTKASPDGSTLGLVSNNHVINPSVYKSMPFDALKDITPISIIGAVPFVLVVNPKVPAKNMKELVALMKAKSDGFNMGSSGNGTILHLAGEMFLVEAGVKARHIPYKGTGPMVTDVLGGQVEMAVVALNAVQPFLKAGSLRAIGLLSDKRSAAAPDIPTLAEQGLRNFNVEGWIAVIGPAGMKPVEVKRVHDAFASAFRSPEVMEAMEKQATSVNPSTPEAAAKYFKSEAERYAALVKKANVTIE